MKSCANQHAAMQTAARGHVCRLCRVVCPLPQFGQRLLDTGLQPLAILSRADVFCHALLCGGREQTRWCSRPWDRGLNTVCGTGRTYRLIYTHRHVTCTMPAAFRSEWSSSVGGGLHVDCGARRKRCPGSTDWSWVCGKLSNVKRKRLPGSTNWSWAGGQLLWYQKEALSRFHRLILGVWPVAHSEHRFPAPSSKLCQWLEEGCRKPVLGVWVSCCAVTKKGLSWFHRLILGLRPVAECHKEASSWFHRLILAAWSLLPPALCAPRHRPGLTCSSHTSVSFFRWDLFWGSESVIRGWQLTRPDA